MTSLYLLMLVASLSAAVSMYAPCHPSPCGPNSECKTVDYTPVCSCTEGFSGHPPDCRATCEIDSDCGPVKVCKSRQCSDPCDGACDRTAECDVRDRTPVCICPPGSTGDPSMGCELIPKIDVDLTLLEISTSISTVPDLPECTTHGYCGSENACINQKCVDPCTGACGMGAECRVFIHRPVCSCPPGLGGDPFVRCDRVLRALGAALIAPKILNLALTAPNLSECTTHGDCGPDKACINQGCSDPCSGVCGVGAECRVFRHHPVCSCPSEYTGDPFRGCVRKLAR